MTPERAKALLPVLQAYADGKTIQYRLDHESTWLDVVHLWENDPECISSEKHHYRVKPQSKLREWKLEEANYHVGDWIRCKNWIAGWGPSLIIGSSNRGLEFVGNWNNLRVDRKTFQELLEEGYEWCPPKTNDWKPCGVEEAQ